MAGRTYDLNATVPAPGIPIGYIEAGQGRTPVYVSEEWRRQWFEPIGVSLFGETGELDVTQGIGDGGIITLGAGTDGNYVQSISSGGNGVSVAGGAGEGSTPVITLSQDLQASASPVFAALTLTGNLTLGGTVAGRNIAADGVKLDTIATGATANQTNAYLLARANHTGTQAFSTLTGTPTTLSGYGIADAYTQSQVDTAVGGKVTKTTGISDAETAHTEPADFAAVKTALDNLGTKINEIIDALNA